MPTTHHAQPLPARTTIPIADVERVELQRLADELADDGVQLAASSLVLVALRQWAWARQEQREAQAAALQAPAPQGGR